MLRMVGDMCIRCSIEYSRLRKPWFRNFGNRHSGGWKLFDWLVYHLSGSAVLSSPEPLCGAVAGFTMPQYLIGFHQSIIDSVVSFWPDSTDTNAGIFNFGTGRNCISVWMDFQRAVITVCGLLWEVTLWETFKRCGWRQIHHLCREMINSIC